MDKTAQDRLRELGIELPNPPAPLASYIPVRTVPIGPDRLMLFVAGQVAMRDGRPLHTGLVPGDVSVPEAQENARACATNILAHLEHTVGLDHVEQVAQVTVYVACAAGFEQQPQVANAASDLLAAVLGDRGRHARVAVGCSALPIGVPVEMSAVVIARGSLS